MVVGGCDLGAWDSPVLDANVRLQLRVCLHKQPRRQHGALTHDRRVALLHRLHRAM